MSGGEITSSKDAWLCLGLAPGAGPDAVLAAFRRAAKASHPDRGGDPERFRQVIDAYRLLKGEPAALPGPPPPPPPQPQARPAPAETVLKITVAEAFLGGAKTVRLADGRRGRIKLPPGLRTGDLVRFGEGQMLPALIAFESGAEVRGDDLWLTVPVTSDFIATGGRLEVHTPFGRKRLWISRSSCARLLFRAPGEGLPEAGAHPRGHLYVQMTVQDEPKPSKSLLHRFAETWAAA